MGRIFAVCSGSGGVGKSTIALSIAVGAAKAGYQTILLDASGISRSCDLIMGMESVVVLDMMDIFKEQISIGSALYPVPHRDHLKFACGSLYDSVPVSDMSGVVLALQTLCEVLVIDLPTGQTDLGAGIMKSGDERLIVTRPDDASMRAAERIMERGIRDQAGMSLIINRVCRDRIKRKTQYDLDTVQTVLDRMAVGSIPEDSSIAEAEKKGRAAIESDGPAKAALITMVKKLLNGAM